MTATGATARIEDGAALPRLCRGRRVRWLLLLVANGLAQAASAVGVAFLVERAFDRIVAGGESATLGALAPIGATLAIAALALGCLRARERADAERLGQSYVHALRTAMYGRLSELSPRAVQSRSQGAVMLRFVGDLTAIARWVSLGLARLLVGGTFLAGALVALAFVSAAMAAAVAAVIGLGASVSLLYSRALTSGAREARRRQTRLAANVGEKVASIGVVQVFGQTERERRRLRRQSWRLQEAMVARAEIVGRLRGLSEVTAATASVAVLMVGGSEVAAGRARPGTVVAAFAIVGLLVGPLRDLGRVNEYWAASRVALEKVRTFLDTPNVLRIATDAPALRPGPGRLELDDVHVDGVLLGVSAVAEAGTVTVVVGPNGAGKSTLLAVAARLLDPDRGAVLLDGQDLSRHSLESIRRTVSMTGPDFPLLRGTVEDNLRYRWPDAPTEEIERVVQTCSLDELFAELPDGPRTRVLQGGRNLSTGQRQRLAIARALVGDPRVLLLDEADANLDARARGDLDRIVAALRRRCTVLVVSHRSDGFEWADSVWRLDGGRLEPLSRDAASRPPIRARAT